MTIRITQKGRAVRDRIICSAAAVVQDKGLAHTTLEDVKAAAKISSSQLFHYFPEGRAALFIAVLSFEIDRFFEEQEHWLQTLEDWPGWEAWCENMISCYTGRGILCGFGRIITQVDPADPATQKLLMDMQSRWEEAIASGVKALQSANCVSSELDPKPFAASLLAGIQGGLLLLRTTGSSSHLEAVFSEATRRLKMVTADGGN
ncbi:TetR/AcrR family transcriptional regulator [Agrobacterium sp. MCAB5]|uniref:TetR/AcrR family transcriptional regulator n=1 Tax=Agrobacterium sp. MCAB5 TaxID=3233042 RepID=UPI003F93DC38